VSCKIVYKVETIDAVDVVDIKKRVCHRRAFILVKRQSRARLCKERVVLCTFFYLTSFLKKKRNSIG